MRKLLVKSALLLAPFALGLVAVLGYASWSPRVGEGVFHPELEGKVRACVGSDTGIVVAGDSGAAWQVVPEVLERRTGLRAANIATAAGDLATLSRAVRRHAQIARARALVVSAGIFQINDGGTAPGYLSTACVLDMTLREKLAVFRYEPRRLLATLADAVAESLAPPPAAPGAAAGSPPCPAFVGLQGTLPLPIRTPLDPRAIGHHWPFGRRLDGARWRVFCEALDRIAATGVRVYVYHAPASPAWRAYSAGSFVERTELEYGAMLADACRKHPNVRFLEFYAPPDPRLTDGLFFDSLHLNAAGAVVFTTILADRIEADLGVSPAGPAGVSARP